jgi:hypothetical protein
MNRSKLIAAFALAAAPLLAAPAFAGERVDEGQYPMPAAQFRQKVEARQQKHRERFEAAVAEKKISPERAAEIRAKMAEKQAKVRAEVDKACADGTVTLDEAKQVREFVKSLHPHGGRHEKRG